VLADSDIERPLPGWQIGHCALLAAGLALM
jgi:hypothetical protein